MAITHGHGNPKWSREETMLALELYFDLGGIVPSSSDNKVINLSNYLRSLSIYSSANKRASFRNPDGVAFKLQNLRSVAIGKGLKNVSKIDREIWAEFGSNPTELKELAKSIRESADILDYVSEYESEDSEFFEGRIVTKVHTQRERNPRLREALLRSRKKKGCLSCDICSITYLSNNLEIQDSQFEAHHIHLHSVSDKPSTKLSEIALLCANCHRLLHKAISFEKRWLSIEEAKSVLELKASLKIEDRKEKTF